MLELGAGDDAFYVNLSDMHNFRNPRCQSRLSSSTLENSQLPLGYATSLKPDAEAAIAVLNERSCSRPQPTDGPGCLQQCREHHNISIDLCVLSTSSAGPVDPEQPSSIIIGERYWRSKTKSRILAREQLCI
jgi:hypothetical protein